MKLVYREALEFLEDLIESEPNDLRFDAEARTVSWLDSSGSHRMILPLTFPVPEASAALNEYVSTVPEVPAPYLIVLMRAGSASLGFFIGGELEAHKVIRKYMVRKSQGKMQISYLNSKGKSRAGSRVRLRESVEFFEEINEKLRDWIEQLGEPEMIFHSCPVRLWSHWFSSDIEPPFENDDLRLIHIPHHVHQPDHDELMRINRLLTLATIEDEITE